jgi:thiamine pyrophosphate-dependent acetolactate synthase large subunit-like protein
MVEVFKRAGVNYVFCSPGTEWPPVWEAFAEAKERGDQISLNEVEKEGFFAEMAKRYPAT